MEVLCLNFTTTTTTTTTTKPTSSLGQLWGWENSLFLLQLEKLHDISYRLSQGRYPIHTCKVRTELTWWTLQLVWLAVSNWLRFSVTQLVEDDQHLCWCDLRVRSGTGFFDSIAFSTAWVWFGPLRPYEVSSMCNSIHLQPLMKNSILLFV